MQSSMSSRSSLCLSLVLLYLCSSTTTLCSGADAQEVDPMPGPGPNDPHFMVLLSSGCSGSSWIWQTIISMVENHMAHNESSVLPILLGPVSRKDKNGNRRPWGVGIGPTKEFLDDRFCHEQVDGEPRLVPSVCQKSDGTELLLQCRQSARLGDAWAGMTGGCGEHLNPHLVRPVGLDMKSNQRYNMILSALMYHLEIDAWDMLTPANTRVAASVKTNALDQLVCMIKDCFDFKSGIPVDAEGNRRRECFQRRFYSLSDAEYKVKFNTSRLLHRLYDLSTRKSETTSWWLRPNYKDRPSGTPVDRDQGIPVGFGKPTPINREGHPLPGEYFEASAEDLTAFEFTAESDGSEWDVSIDSWTALLRSLGAPANRTIIRQVLQNEMVGRKPRKHHSHTETIFEPGKVKALLRGTPFEWMWRD